MTGYKQFVILWAYSLLKFLIQDKHDSYTPKQMVVVSIQNFRYKVKSCISYCGVRQFHLKNGF